MSRQSSIPSNHALGLITVSLLLAGCGGTDSGDAEVLDCAWVESENCWKQQTDEIAACAPDPTLTGTFTSDSMSCSYSDGARVDFDSPVLPGTTEAPNALTVYRDDTLCARYDNTAGTTSEAALVIESESGVLTTSGTSSGFTVTCPDGSSFFTESPLSLVSGCSGEGSLPGLITTRNSPNRLGLALALGEQPGGQDIEVVLFDCEWP